MTTTPKTNSVNPLPYIRMNLEGAHGIIFEICRTNLFKVFLLEIGLDWICVKF